MNTYGYVENNPANLVDPDGLNPIAQPIRLIPITPITIDDGFTWTDSDSAYLLRKYLTGLCSISIQCRRYLTALNSAADDTNETVPDSAADDTTNKEACPPSNKTDDGDRCYKNYENDLSTCRAIGRIRGAVRAEACYASATERLAACQTGKPIPPLNTWNN